MPPPGKTFAMVQRAATTDVQRLIEAEAQALELLPAPAYRTEHLPAAHNIASVDGTVAALGAGPLLHRYPPDGRDDFDPARREALGNTPLLWSHAECARALFELDRQRSLARRLRRLVSRRRVGSSR